ncbi:hypothetical protein [Ruegeria meonggei]|uniref:Uncharacterized protein n=1 Tax=Ruegeria meonggei TaxID=1446476 RepID=A0A1X6ZBM8_9RHOB|nr:hypothetical protein [Ruegeria meonggei]SLN46318.1 hypothetical protein RUM8411_02169 [Ruegeria meonggei]
MLLRTVSMLLVGGLSASAALAQSEINLDEFSVNCVSDVDQKGVTLSRSGGSDKGFIATDTLEGEASIFPGLNTMTFLLIQGSDVVTFVVDYTTMEYDMRIKGAVQKNDKGTCTVA